MVCSTAFSTTTDDLCEITGITSDQIAQWSDAVQQIDWSKAKVIGGGVFSTVFDIGNGCVVKVGRVTPVEAALTDIMALEGLGVNMYGYAQNSSLPEDISRANCPVHGKARSHRNNIESRLYWGTFECTCDTPQSVMIMEKGEILSKADERERQWDMDRVTTRARQTMRRYLSQWFDDAHYLHPDRHTDNLVTINDEIRAIDFGLLCDKTGEPPLDITEQASVVVGVISYALTHTYTGNTARSFDKLLRGSLKYPPDSFGRAAPLVAVALLRSWEYGADAARRFLLSNEQPWTELRKLAGDTQLIQALIAWDWLDPHEYAHHAHRIAEYDPDLARRMQDAVTGSTHTTPQ